jgi:hypothetical protein
MTGRAEVKTTESTAVDDVAPVADRATFKLSKPMAAMGRQISELSLRAPLGSDLLQVGNPVVFYPYEDPPKVEHNMAKMVAMAARLSGQPSSSVAKIETDDLIKLTWMLSPFFVPSVLFLGENDEYTLPNPVTIDGAPVSILKFRKPLSADIIKIGNPVELYPHVEPVRIEFDMPKMVEMAAVLAGVPREIFNDLDAREVVGMCWALSPFFMPMKAEAS